MPHPIPTQPLLMAMVLLAACSSGDDPPDREAGHRPPRATEGQSAPGTGTGSPANADHPVCLQATEFIADGPLPLDHSSPGHATRIGGLRWERHEGGGACERFVIDLVGEDAEPAAVAGQVGAEVLRGVGVVRVRLGAVTSVDPAATDARFGGPLARAAYAVRSRGGRSIYVDLHLAEPAEVSGRLLADPARVVVDLRAGGGALPAAPAVGQRVVVLEPRPGRAAYPLTVSGYARTFEANVVARLERSGEVVREEFTTATAWADTWGHYSMTIADGPDGPVRLHVGEHSARDGAWQGVAVELEMR